MSPQTKILIVEHDPNDLELILYELKAGGLDYVSEVVKNEPDYRHALTNFIPDIILSDYSLPSFNGPTAFKVRDEMAPQTPFLYVSGTIGEENSIELIRTGLTDYVLKDKMFTLIPKVNRALAETREKKQKFKTEQERLVNERRLARAQEIAHMGSWELTFVSGIGMWSDEACRIYGIPCTDNIQTYEVWLSFIHPEDLEFVLFKMKTAQGNLTDSSFHHRILRKDGTIRYIHSECKFEIDAAGKATGIYGIIQDITERKAAEREMEVSEMRFREFFENSPIALSVLDLNSMKFIRNNNAAIELFGFSKAELNKMGLVDISAEFQPDGSRSVEKAREYLLKVLRDEKPVFEWVYDGARGHQVICEISLILLSNINGPLILATNVDVTERKKTQQAIIESAVKLNKAQEIAKVGSWELTFPENILTLSDEGARIFGFPSDQNRLTFETWSTLVHPDDIDSVLRKIEKSQQAFEDTTYEHRIILKDGTIKYIYSESKFQFDTAGNATGMYGINRDVTEAKLAEEQRTFDRNNLAALINNTNDLMWSVDREFKLITSNNAFNESVRRTCGKIILKGGSVLIPEFTEENISRHKAYYERAFTGETFSEIESNNIAGDSWSELSFHPIRSGIEIIGTACHSHDITKIKNAKIEIKELNENLELRIIERTAELTESNIALEAFSYSVSHDLRSPVRSIMGFSKIIRKDHLHELSSDARELFAYIDGSSQRMNSIIDDLLKLAKWGLEKLNPREVNMNDLISKVWDNILFETPHNARLNLGPMPKVFVDASMFEQVVANLVSNAVKYSSKSPKPLIKIGFEQIEKELIFHISDNGAGFNMQFYDRLFGAFQRLHGVTEFEGTGVGLLLVKRIVERHGGRVWAEGEVDKGATFYFVLPAL